MRYIKTLLTACAAWVCLAPLLTFAQTEPPPSPTPIATTTTETNTAPPATATPAASNTPVVHTVQEGEVLFSIAEQYETTAEAIQILNNITNPDTLFVGQELFIPGAEGEAVPLVYIVDVGDTFEDIIASYNATITDVVSLNNIVQPAALYAGARLSLLSRTGSISPQTVLGVPHLVTNSDTVITIAAAYNISVSELVSANELTYPYRLYPGQQIRIPLSDTTYYHLPNGWTEIAMTPLTLGQGTSAAIYVNHIQEGTPVGRLTDPEGTVTELIFAPHEQGFVALFGLDSFAPAGRYTLELGGIGLLRPWLPFTQDLVVRAGVYGLQQITISDDLAALLAPEIRAQEDAFLNQIFTMHHPEKRWDGVFLEPVTNTVVTAVYGDARSYNGGPVEIFHTGIDYGGSVGTPIIAPAAGTIIFTGTLNIRGETLIIDHGLGVMTAYYHLSGYEVAVGEDVVAGQLVARGGDTGLSTGPHLHWDLRIMGTAVEPQQWLSQPFP